MTYINLIQQKTPNSLFFSTNPALQGKYSSLPHFYLIPLQG